MSSNKARPKICVICKRRSAEMYDLFCAGCYDDHGARIEIAADTIPYTNREAWEEEMRQWWEDEVMPHMEPES